MAKQFRAVEQGFYDGHLINVGVTFTPHEGFDANWAVEVEGHDDTPANAGDQEALNSAFTPNLPTVDPSLPLPEFHPTAAVLGSDKVKISLDEAGAQNASGDAISATAALTSTSDPAKATASRKRPGADAISTGTAPSDAEKKEAYAANASEVDAKAAAEGEKKDGNDLL